MKRAASRKGRTGLAIIAALALLVQFASAQLAMAAPAPTHQTIEVCTGHGRELVQVEIAPGQQPPKAPCSHCEFCVTPALAAEPAVASLAGAVRYAIRTDAVRPAAALSPYAARAPPRPPGQGPPSSLNV